MISVFTNAVVFDGQSEVLAEGANVVIEGDRIREVTSIAPDFADAQVIDCKGRVLMPGLIDAHFHAYTPSFNLRATDRMPRALLVCHARQILEGALSRGFTTVRDAGGGDVGLWMAIEEGLIRGPRFFFSGKAISQTGGHGDLRPGTESALCGCRYNGVQSVIADGPDEMRRSVREQLREGATQIKLYLSGGVLSPSDPVWMPQFADEEICVAVAEAASKRTYVMAHCHTDDAVLRCVANGVRSIEHGTRITAGTAAKVSSAGAFVVPTLSVVDVLRKHGKSLGVSGCELNKVDGLYEDMAQSIENCSQAGVNLGLGTDLLDHAFHPLQGGELSLRAQISTPLDVLRSATSVNASILNMSGKLGCIQPGAYADIVVLDKNPFKEISLFEDPAHIPLVMRAGAIIRNRL